MAHLRAVLLSSVICNFAAAVTVIPLTLNLPKPYESAVLPATSDSDLLSRLYEGTTQNKEAIYSPYVTNKKPLNGIWASQDSFFHGVIDASAKNQHLVIQPQDVWLTVLKQLSFYLRKHTDDKEVAENWDNLDGKTTKPLWGYFALIATWTQDQFNLRSKADWLLNWVRPSFSTVYIQDPGVTQNSTEEMMANALMMSSPSPSTEDLPSFPCKNGFPSITLNGSKEDWRNLLDKVDSLAKFGKEPEIFSHMLHAVLTRFVQTFDKPNDPVIRLFWNDIVTITARQKLCSTTDLITGWINAFHMWAPNGDLAITSAIASSTQALQLDGITFPWRHRKDTPVSNNRVPLCIEGDTPRWGSYAVLVGMLGKSVKKGKPDGYEAALKAVGFALPASVKESDHSILKALPIWIAHADSTVCISFLCVLQEVSLITCCR
jgi:hypothetical protein